jgi:hypothetical protein
MDQVYVLQQVTADDQRTQIVGVFAALGLAEQARDQLIITMSDEKYDSGIYYRIIDFELGRIYN